MNATSSDMSEELKRKLYYYEVNPPEIMWSRIASALDEEINAEFPQKLYEAELTPPSGVWNKITAALETDIQEEYPAKLYNLEVAPPAGAWEKISDALDEEKAIPKIPPKRKIVPFVRYAAAACIIGIIAFSTFKLLNKKTSEQARTGKVIIPQNISPTVTPPESQNSSAQTVPAPSNNLPKEVTVLAKTNAVPKRKPLRQQTGYMTQMADATTGLHNSTALNFQQAGLLGNIPGSNSLVSDADRYLMFMNPDGYLIRISKKLAEALGCFYTNGNSEEYKQCQEQIKKWRDKIAQSSATSSPDNFMDILDIIKSVQDNEL
ncbi:MAG TPA: hypothetical protein VGQ09_08000 [Chitinophagaceae bacterium]|jgi:hypothetical protein|nr:hypothetical protein [Chitinophagaceae bacterium]